MLSLASVSAYVHENDDSMCFPSLVSTANKTWPRIIWGRHLLWGIVQLSVGLCIEVSCLDCLGMKEDPVHCGLTIPWTGCPSYKSRICKHEPGGRGSQQAWFLLQVSVLSSWHNFPQEHSVTWQYKLIKTSFFKLFLVRVSITAEEKKVEQYSLDLSSYDILCSYS